MTVLYITTYENTGAGPNTAIPAPLEPALGHFTVSFTTAAAVLLATGFAATAKLAMISADGIFHYRVGTVSTIAATATNARVAADQMRFIALDRPGLFISAIGGA
jgi:hypothetical protein